MENRYMPEHLDWQKLDAAKEKRSEELVLMNKYLREAEAYKRWAESEGRNSKEGKFYSRRELELRALAQSLTLESKRKESTPDGYLWVTNSSLGKAETFFSHKPNFLIGKGLPAFKNDGTEITIEFGGIGAQQRERAVPVFRKIEETEQR